MNVTLQWLLQESSLNNLKIVSCFDQTDTVITGVNILDNPDTVQWFKPGELILTTGYIFVDNLPLQLQVLEDVKNAGCSGLCLKMRRFFDAFPEAMLQKATELGLVCIELPYEYSLAEISEEINRKIYSIPFEEAASEQMFFNSLFNGFFQGNSLNEILQLVSDYLHCSVLILDDQNQISWYSLLPADFPEFSENKTPTPEYIQINKHSPASLYTTGTLTLFGQTNQISLLPLSNPRYHFCLWHKEPQTLPWDTIMHILKIIDFSRIDARIRPSNISNYYDSFFHYLLEPESFSETSAIQLFEYYGIPYAPKAICVILSKRNKKQEFHADSLVPLLKKVLPAKRKRTPSYFIGYNRNQLCLCLFEQDLQILNQVLDLIRNHPEVRDMDLLAGVSRPALHNLSEAYKEASYMISLSHFFPEEHVFTFRDYMLFWTISKIPEAEKKSLYEMTIQPLVEFDQKNHANLTETLQMYFRCHLNSSLAATKLYIHRNTFLKRMEKIQTLIDFQPDNHNNMFSVFYCLCIYQTLSER